MDQLEREKIVQKALFESSSAYFSQPVKQPKYQHKRIKRRMKRYSETGNFPLDTVHFWLNFLLGPITVAVSLVRGKADRPLMWGSAGTLLYVLMTALVLWL